MKQKMDVIKQRKRNITIVIGILILMLIAYILLTYVFEAVLNPYELTATAFEEFATFAAENDDVDIDPFSLTASKIFFQATASPGFFETKAANSLREINSTQDYWSTLDVTPTLNDAQSTDIAFISGVTQTVEVRLASGCVFEEVDHKSLDIDYVENFDEPKINHQTFFRQKLRCPQNAKITPYWYIDTRYSINLRLPDSITETMLNDAVSRAIELISDYPLENSSTPLSLVRIYNKLNYIDFSYNDAITALEAGLHGQELLDELGIVVEMP